jgi:hypothetical protein
MAPANKIVVIFHADTPEQLDAFEKELIETAPEYRNPWQPTRGVYLMNTPETVADLYVRLSKFAPPKETCLMVFIAAPPGFACGAMNWERWAEDLSRPGTT